MNIIEFQKEKLIKKIVKEVKKIVKKINIKMLINNIIFSRKNINWKKNMFIFPKD